MQTVFNGTYMGLNDPRYKSRTEFYLWFDKYVKSIATITDEEKKLDVIAKEWCETNDREWREDGVYNMNIMTYTVAFKCAHCKIDIHRDTPAQVDCVTNDGETWFCHDCRKHRLSNDDYMDYDSDINSLASDDSIWGQMQIDMITTDAMNPYNDFGINWQPGWSWDIDHWKWTGMSCATPKTKPYGSPTSEMKSNEIWWRWSGATECNVLTE